MHISYPDDEKTPPTLLCCGNIIQPRQNCPKYGTYLETKEEEIRQRDSRKKRVQEVKKMCHEMTDAFTLFLQKKFGPGQPFATRLFPELLTEFLDGYPKYPAEDARFVFRRCVIDKFLGKERDTHP